MGRKVALVAFIAAIAAASFLDGRGDAQSTGLYVSTCPADSREVLICYGAGVPTALVGAGSLYLRTDGVQGAAVYYSFGGGSWESIGNSLRLSIEVPPHVSQFRGR